MSSQTRVLYWAEGPTDRAAAREIIRVCGGVPGPDYSERRGAASGKGRLDQKLNAYNAAAAHEAFFVLRDFDGEFKCPGGLAKKLLPKPAPRMCFRIAVPEIEAWIMADAEVFSAWLGVAVSQVPTDLEKISSGKGALLGLARKSKRSEIKEDLLPRSGSGRNEGSLYATRLIEFIQKQWCPLRAGKSGRVPALQRAVDRLQVLIKNVELD